MQLTNNADVRLLNRSRVLRSIITEERASIQNIAAQLHLSVSTVQSCVRELIDQKAIKEDGVFESTGGRNAKVIVPVVDYRVAYGLDITRHHLGMVKINSVGNILELRRLYFPFDSDKDSITKMVSLLNTFIDETSSEHELILGVGISMPGIFNASGTVVTFSHALSLRDFSCEIISSQIQYPCHFINDANAGCYAEFSLIPHNSNMLYLSLSNSVGGALFTNGTNYLGDNLRAAEFGHCTLIPGGEVCYCGKRGCINAYCAATVLSKHTENNLQLFFQQLESGNPSFSLVWDTYVQNLCTAINNLRMAFDCDIMIGGYVGQYISPYFPKIKTILSELNTFENSGDYLIPCRYKSEAAAVGAALIPVNIYIDAPIM